MHPADSEDPLARYNKRIASLRSAFATAARRTRLFQWMLALVAAALPIGFVMTRRHPSLPLWPLAALLPIASIAAYGLRNSIVRSKTLFRLFGYYERGLARLTREWDSLPPGEEYLDSTHLYADGLNLFGRGSLYQILCSARTRAGKNTLARWMKEPASIEEARARSVAVRELRSCVDLREAVAAAGPSESSDFQIETFREWIQSAPPNFPPWLRWSGFSWAAPPCALARRVWSNGR